MLIYVELLQTPPTAKETGFCDTVYADEIGGTPVIVFKQGQCSIHLLFC